MIGNEWPGDAANAAFPEHFRQVGSGTPTDGASVVTLAVDDRFTLRAALAGRPMETVVSQAGQLVLHSHEPDETAVLDVMRRCHGQLSVAQALCEAGLFEIYRAVCQLRGVRTSRSNAAQVALAATRAESPECAHAISMFCGLLGDAAGRAALTFGSRGGVFVEGTLVGQLGDTFARSPFRRRFENVGRFPDTLRVIPTFINRVRLLDVATLGTRQGSRQYRIR